MTTGLVKTLVKTIAKELQINEANTFNAIQLLFEENCTIPFVTRYRKEKTGGMDEVQLRALRDRYTYLSDLEATKERYLKVVEEHCNAKPELRAKFPEIKKKFETCQTKQELEDLYLPFKPKRRTRASIAREKGLEPLLTQILETLPKISDLISMAMSFVTPSDSTLDKALWVADEKAALSGASDIFAEHISDNAEYRSLIRQMSFSSGLLVAKKNDGASANKDASAASKYENYFDYSETIDKALSHRIMAVRRGEAEKFLKVSIEVDTDRIIEELYTKITQEKQPSPAAESWLKDSVEDAYKRLISPSIETEIRLYLKGKAEDEAIKVFTTNLSKLLLLPPIPGRTVCGIDPGIRTGSKLAVVSETGKLLDYKVIYPQFDDHKNQNPSANLQAKDALKNMLLKHNVGCVAIGNGTGSREIDRIVIDVIKENQLKDIKRIVVNEAGASVYSTDEIAREEFPDLDPTIRSAVSIARRLQDPLAELVKIDPRSLGVGQYQHDCDVNKLNNSLKETVESCVNHVGVNVNTASYKLLSYVSGIGPTLAKNIVAFRDQDGAFSSRDELQKISGFGNKTFEQAAGFLRIPSSKNLLDNSAVHPESYSIVERMAEDLKLPLHDLIGKKEIVEHIPLEKYVADEIGMPTLIDIAKELVKPGRDPREDGIRLMFSDEVSCIEDLKIGMKLKGTVSNVTKFGAFVDIGVHQDGLVHISELSDKFINDPASCVAVGDILDVCVIDVDRERKRISLSCKAQGQKAQQAPAQDNKAAPRRDFPRQGAPVQLNSSRSHHVRHDERKESTSPLRDSRHQGPNKGYSSDRNDRRPDLRDRPSQFQSKKKEPAKSYSMGDLLSKFNNRG